VQFTANITRKDWDLAPYSPKGPPCEKRKCRKEREAFLFPMQVIGAKLPGRQFLIKFFYNK
jgi:hypothetical protein